MDKNGQKVEEMKKKKHEFYSFKIQKNAQSQLNFASSHDGEMVTFRN